jgi:hypothetical protein
METIPEWLGAFIVLAPILIFVIVMLVIRARLRDQSVNLADLLAETDVVMQNQTNQMSSKAEGEPAPTPPQKRSASRLILFLSGVTSLILTVCITTFYFYMNIYCISCASGMDLSDFTNVLLALGIGVVPYSVNQIKKVRL